MRELPILTAQPDAAARAAFPHRLYGVLSAAETLLGRALGRHGLGGGRRGVREGMLPIVAGGTGLYLRGADAGLGAGTGDSGRYPRRGAQRCWGNWGQRPFTPA